MGRERAANDCRTGPGDIFRPYTNNHRVSVAPKGNAPIGGGTGGGGKRHRLPADPNAMQAMRRISRCASTQFDALLWRFALANERRGGNTRVTTQYSDGSLTPPMGSAAAWGDGWEICSADVPSLPENTRRADLRLYSPFGLQVAFSFGSLAGNARAGLQ